MNDWLEKVYKVLLWLTILFVLYVLLSEGLKFLNYLH